MARERVEAEVLVDVVGGTRRVQLLVRVADLREPWAFAFGDLHEDTPDGALILFAQTLRVRDTRGAGKRLRRGLEGEERHHSVGANPVRVRAHGGGESAPVKP